MPLVCKYNYQVITAPTAPLVYNSLAEIVRANFKILQYDSYEYFQMNFIDQFEHFGLSETDLNKTFQFYQDSEEKWLAKSGKQRYSIEIDISIGCPVKSYFENEIEMSVFNGTRNDSVQCHMRVSSITVSSVVSDTVNIHYTVFKGFMIQVLGSCG